MGKKNIVRNMGHRLALSTLLGALVAAALPALAGPVVINEIHYDPPDRTKLEEFVELYNQGDLDVDLSGWFFSSGMGYVFPPGTVIPADGYVVVAKDPDAWSGRMPGQPLGPFDGWLSSEGERIVLRNALGEIEDEVDYKVEFPWPLGSAGNGSSMELIDPILDNDLGGSWRASTGAKDLPESPVVLLGAQDPEWHYRKGTSEASDPVGAWREVDFVEDASWSVGRTSIGYEDNDDNTVLSDMLGNYQTVYLRHAFTLEGPDLPPALRIRMYVDDGSIVWINGAEVARFHVPPGDQPYNGRGYGHEAAWEDLLIPDARAFLRPGVNMLAIHALNQLISSTDFSIDAELQIPERGVLPPAPSPGQRNTVYSAVAPPQIRQVEHFPIQPPSGGPFVITAKVTDPQGVGAVTLHYQAVPPGSFVPALLPLPFSVLLATPTKPQDPNPAFEDPASWVSVSMRDDGQGSDSLGGDGTYTAVIPAQANRTLVRYRITASDSAGAEVTVPYPDDRSLNFACFVYDGVPPYQTTKASVHPEGVGHVYPAELLTSIPVYFLITRAQDITECYAYNGAFQIPKSNEGARDAFNWEGAFVYEGVVYDHVTYRLRQANDRYGGAGKRSMRIRFHKGRYLEARDDHGKKYPTKWRTLNVGKQFDNLRVGNFGITETLNSILWNMVGVPAPFFHTFHFRVVDGRDEAPAGTNGQYYGDFWGMFCATEDYDPRFLDAHELADGNLYKLKDGIFDGNKIKRNQGRFAVTTDADFQNIRANLRPTQPAAWLSSHVRYEKWYPYHTVVEAIRHYDFVPADSHSKNRAWYFEPADGTEYGLLWTLPHDSDASWGPNWNSGIDYSTAAIATGADKAPFRLEYRNVIREFRDLLWREEVINPTIDDLAALVRDFSFADRDRWRGAPADAGSQDFGALDTKVQDMKNFAFKGWTGSTGPAVGPGGRAAYLDSLANQEGDGTAIPATPSVAAVTPGKFPVDGLLFESSPFTDPQGDGTFRSMKWRLAEVDPSGAAPSPGEPRLYEWKTVWDSGELEAFQARIALPPSVVKVGRTYRVRVRMTDTTGRASHWSEPLEFTTAPPENSIPQVEFLRVTEIMYHPPADGDYEYIELQNVGADTLDLSQVAFTAGISFAFAGSDVETLGPGEFVVVVKNRAVFESLYDASGINVAGEYAGKLDNAGEEIALSWGASPVIDFTYDDTWYPETDGGGRSLVIVDPNGPTSQWGTKDGWRPSSEMLGSPGVADGEVPQGGLVRPGDMNLDGKLDISDAIGILGHLFLGTPAELPCSGQGGTTEAGTKLADLNGDGELNITDAIHALHFLFQGGEPPALGVDCVRIEGCRDACTP